MRTHVVLGIESEPCGKRVDHRHPEVLTIDSLCLAQGWCRSNHADQSQGTIVVSGGQLAERVLDRSDRILLRGPGHDVRGEPHRPLLQEPEDNVFFGGEVEEESSSRNPGRIRDLVDRGQVSGTRRSYTAEEPIAVD